MAKINLNKNVLQAEKELDSFYKSHPFIKLQKVEALWYILCVSEEIMLMKTMDSIDDLHLAGQFVDEMKYILKYCMQWINQSCPPGGKIPNKSDQKLKNQAIEFLKIGREYQVFVVQYTLALDGYINIDVDNNSLVIDYPPNYDPRIEAYDMLIINDEKESKIDASK